MDQVWSYKERLPEVFQSVFLVHHRLHQGLSGTGNLQHNLRMKLFTSELKISRVVTKENERERTT